MGAGLAIFVLCIIIFIPIFIISFAYFYKYKQAAAIEISNLESTGVSGQSAKTRLYYVYGITLMLFYYGFWLPPLAKLLGFDDEPGIIYHLLKGAMSWDFLGDVLVYWSVLIGIFLLMYLYLIGLNKKHNIKLYDTNKYVATVYLVGLYPFIVLSFIGWAGSWEPQKRFYQSDEILANFGYSNKAIEQQLGVERVEALQSIMSWADTYEIPFEWLPRNITKLNATKLLKFHTCSKRPLSLPEALGELNKLRGVHVIQCGLLNVPNSIIQLKNLHGLVLRSNDLQGMPDGLSQLENLTVLDIGGNKLQSISEDIGGLIRLTELKLSGNKIPILPNSLAELKQLSTLYIAQNQLTELPDYIGRLPNLRKLDISNNQITHIPDTVLELLRKKQLKYFSYSGNPLSSEEVRRIEASVDKTFTSYYWNRN